MVQKIFLKIRNERWLHHDARYMQKHMDLHLINLLEEEKLNEALYNIRNPKTLYEDVLHRLIAEKVTNVDDEWEEFKTILGYAIEKAAAFQVDKGRELEPDFSPLALCKNAPSAQCWTDAWLPIAKEIGIPAAVQLITDAAARNPQGNESLHCHEILHELGYLTYDSGYTMRTALAWGMPYTTHCSNGYIHGSLERFLYAQELADLTSKLGTYCSDWGIDPTTNMSVACLHIVGHAIVKHAEESNQDWLQALGNCVKVPEDQQEMCWGGGFMQHFINAEHIKTLEKGWPLEKAYYPCDVLPAEWGEVAKRYCAMEASTQIYKTVKQDAKMAFEVCDTKATETPSILEGCKLGLGKSILAHESMNIDRMIEKCASVGDECLQNVAWMFANNTNDQASALLICAPSSSEDAMALCAKSVKEGSGSLTGSHN